MYFEYVLCLKTAKKVGEFFVLFKIFLSVCGVKFIPESNCSGDLLLPYLYLIFISLLWRISIN